MATRERAHWRYGAPSWVPRPAPAEPRFYCRWQPGCGKGIHRVIYHHVDCHHNRPEMSRPVTIEQYVAILALRPNDRWGTLKGRAVELVICQQCKRYGIEEREAHLSRLRLSG